MRSEYFSKPENVKNTLSIASSLANNALGTSVQLPAAQVAELLAYAKMHTPMVAAAAGAALDNIRQSVDEYKQIRDLYRQKYQEALANLEASYQESLDGYDEPGLESGSAALPSRNIERTRDINSQAAGDEDDQYAETEARQINEPEPGRQKSGDAESVDQTDSQGYGEEQQRATQFQQQTNRLKQQLKRKLKQKAKAAAKEQVKKQIKKKVKQRIMIWLAAAISPEVLLIIAIVIIAIIVIIIIIVYACDIPGVSQAIDLFGPEEFAGICDSVEGSVGNSDIESVPLPSGL